LAETTWGEKINADEVLSRSCRKKSSEFGFKHPPNANLQLTNRRKLDK
jgi:hypothetical protein